MSRQVSKKPKIVYVLGQAYSGTTLFSLALGNDDAFLNLGEVSSLENDYRNRMVCTCGKSLDDCPFWDSLRSRLEKDRASGILNFHLQDASRAEFLDRRGRSIWENIGLALGLPITWIYKSHELSRYRGKNEQFFKTVCETFPQYEYLVDCSKSSERLATLLNNESYDIWCVYLKRSSWSVAASKLKRVKNGNPISGFFIALKYMLWQKARQSRVEKIFGALPADKKLMVNWEAFVQKPQENINLIKDLLGVKQKKVQQSSHYKINTSLQHVYVGNRWLFRGENKEVKFRLHHDVGLLSKAQRFAVRLVFGRPPV